MPLPWALAAQVTAHLIAAGYALSSAWLVAAVSAVPPVVVAHIMHMVARAHVAVQEDAVEELEAPAAPVAEPEDATLPPADLSLIQGRAGEPEEIPLPGLEAQEEPEVRKVPAKGGRSLEDIRAAVAKLKADGQPVNGTTYAKLVGVSGRTARRDLQALAA
ncbi:hypothetical protein ABZ313_09310 [Streptomyces sp. NPDC006251]|uniref:hypothetical protein n=1 Tax=Streptomyces sp. NPDC006251 TaxID=3155718 RepID=UPI0033AC1CA8